MPQISCSFLNLMPMAGVLALGGLVDHSIRSVGCGSRPTAYHSVVSTMSGEQRIPPLPSDVRTGPPPVLCIEEFPITIESVARLPKTLWWLAAATPPTILAAHYLAVLPHEFMHSFVAWATGIKSNPFVIHWGDTSPGNVLLLYYIDEKVDYKAAYAAGKTASVAATAIAGPATNVVLYLVIRFMVPLWRTSTRPYVTYLAFWFLFMQLANVYDYVPIRVAASDGDVGQWVRATHMSPWLIYVVVGYLVLWAMIDLYRTVLPESLDSSRIVLPAGRAIVLVLATVVMFTYFAYPGIREDGLLSNFIARTSMLLIPVIIVVNWRRIVTRPGSPTPAQAAS
jgi:hypothetical protein